MKPRNKYQKRIVELSDRLPKISEKQMQWGYDNCFPSYYVISRNRMYCLECNHKWLPEGPEWQNEIVGSCTCPNCGKKLKKMRRDGPWYNVIAFMTILTVVDGFQVERNVYLNKMMHKKHAPRFFGSEIVRKFFEPSGKTTTIAISVQYGHGYHNWQISSDLSLKDAFDLDERYMVYPDGIYPERKILPVFRRNGFNGRFYGMAPHKLFYKLVHSPRAETLIKANQPKLLKSYLVDRASNVERYWPSIKICIRNGYKVNSPDMWFDYLDLLSWFQKDLHNAKYVCPPNLKKAHDRLVDKKREIQRKQELEKARREVEKADRYLAEKKAHLFHLEFKSGPITVKVLQTGKEFMEEGDKLKHCLFANEYYKNPTLIMSARKGDEVLETIEISLKDFEIIQCRGFRNGTTKYHNKIVQLVNDNMAKIRETHTKHIK